MTDIFDVPWKDVNNDKTNLYTPKHLDPDDDSYNDTPNNYNERLAVGFRMQQDFMDE